MGFVLDRRRHSQREQLRRQRRGSAEHSGRMGFVLDRRRHSQREQLRRHGQAILGRLRLAWKSSTEFFWLGPISFWSSQSMTVRELILLRLVP